MTAGDLKMADNHLARLTNAVVTVYSKVSVHNDKARDNLALARNFIASKNYDGARFALKHADEALDEMQNNAGYKSRRADIVAMRKDVSNLQTYITKKDPTAIEQADNKLSQWWDDMKTWTEGYE